MNDDFQAAQGSTDQKVTTGDAGRIASDVKQTSSGAAGTVTRTLTQARDSITDSYQGAKETVAQVQAAVTDKGAAAANATVRYIREYPLVAVGAAATIGMVLGALTRRR